MEFNFEQSDPIPSEREIVPEGIHRMEIIHAECGPNQWKVCDANPEGLCLKLRLKLDDYKFVFNDIPQHLGWLAKQLGDSIGVVPEDGKINLTPKSITGREVMVEIEHYTSKVGRISAVVKRFLPATKQPQKRKAPHMKSAVALTDEAFPDDVPF